MASLLAVRAHATAEWNEYRCLLVDAMLLSQLLCSTNAIGTVVMTTGGSRIQSHRTIADSLSAAMGLASLTDWPDCCHTLSSNTEIDSS